MRSEIIQDFAPCNQDCVFCNAPEMPPGLPTARTKETILRLRADGVGKFIFSGGEPTLRKDLPELLRFAKEHGAEETEIYTNAIRCDDAKYARELAAAGLDAAFVSLHHHDEAVSDLLTRSPGTFRRTLKGIRNLHRTGVTITINIVVNSINYRDLKKTLLFVFKRFPFTRFVSISFVMSGPRALANPGIVPKMSAVAPYLTEAYDFCLTRNMPFSNPGCGVPVCFVPGHYMYSFEYILLKDQSPSLRLTMEKNQTEKTKLPVCEACVFKELCLGVWKGYLRIHGTGEIKPVRVKPAVSDLCAKGFSQDMQK